MRVDPILSVLFCTFFFVLVNYALMEMLIAVMMENFEISDEQKMALQMLQVSAPAGDDDVLKNLADAPVIESADPDRNKENDLMAVEDMLEELQQDRTTRLLFVMRRASAYKLGLPEKVMIYQWKLNMLGDKGEDFFSPLSMFCIPMKNPLRKKALEIVQLESFEYSVFAVILISSMQSQSQ